MPKETYQFFETGPFKLPVLNHDHADGIYTMGISYPKAQQGPGRINSHLAAFMRGNVALVPFLSHFFSLHLRVDQSLILSCVPSFGKTSDLILQKLVADICQSSDRKIDGTQLFRYPLQLAERDRDTLERHVVLHDQHDVANKTVVLFSLFHDTALAVCQAKLRCANATVYSICFSKYYDAVSPESGIWSKYLRYSYDLLAKYFQVTFFGEPYKQWFVQEKDGGWMEDDNDGIGPEDLVPFTTCHCNREDAYRELLPLIFDDLSPDKIFKYANDPRREIVELANAEMEEIFYNPPDEAHLAIIQLAAAQQFRKAIKYAAHLDRYLASHCCLLLGEHDFSLTAAIIKKHDGSPLVPLALIATEYMSRTALLGMHRGRIELLQRRLAGLTAIGVKILFDVDGREVDRCGKLPQRIPYIQFTFPHDGSSFKERTLPKLLEDFFRSVVLVQIEGDRVAVVLAQPAKKKEFYEGYIYGIVEASARAGYQVEGKTRFHPERYPGYEHAKTRSDGGAAVAQEGRKYTFRKTSLSYEEILAITHAESLRFFQEQRSVWTALRTANSDTESQFSMSSFQRPELKRRAVAIAEEDADVHSDGVIFDRTQVVHSPSKCART